MVRPSLFECCTLRRAHLYACQGWTNGERVIFVMVGELLQLADQGTPFFISTARFATVSSPLLPPALARPT